MGNDSREQLRAEAAKRLGKRVRQLRRAHRWTQEELGERAEMHDKYIGDIERGARNPSEGRVARPAHALDVSIGTLFESDDEI